MLFQCKQQFFSRPVILELHFSLGAGSPQEDQTKQVVALWKRLQGRMGGESVCKWRRETWEGAEMPMKQGLRTLKSLSCQQAYIDLILSTTLLKLACEM